MSTPKLAIVPIAKTRAILDKIPAQSDGNKPRKVTIYVGRVPLTVDEPEWCKGHEGDDAHVSNLADFAHIGQAVEIPVPQPDGTALGGMSVVLTQWPFSAPGDNNQPYLSVEDDGTGQAAALDSVAGMAFADRLRAYADEVEGKARQLAVYEQNGGQA
ncbi:DUF6907 domain-containing protein [Streptomyces sp. NPDC050355]|uniref:DUF6907 domain-containing protein n=1 Tax=Streptomyces sp. NPDC050355 TaxID=3365609 RepID=UPI0037A357C8